VRDTSLLIESLLTSTVSERERIAAEWLEQTRLNNAELETVIGALRFAFSEKQRQLDVASREELRCSFCHRSQREVRTLVAATEAAICDECIAIAAETAASRR
jgi:hypothetical protein